MKRRPIASLVSVSASLFAADLALGAEDRFALKSSNDILFSEFKGYEQWRMIGSRQSDEPPTYRSFATFNDPYGNNWLSQDITTRLPGRGLSNPDVATLTELLRETEKYHGEYEPAAPRHHWSDWNAAYLVARPNGRTPEDAVKDATLHLEGAHR